jgi:hypothetical protein
MTGQARYTPCVASANDIYRDLLALPEEERLQLVERIIHDLVDAARHRTAASPVAAGNSVIGLWADEPEAVDQMIEGVLQERETRQLRANSDSLRNG